MGKILIIDDNDINRSLLMEVLSLKGLESDSVDSVSKALKIYNENDYDLVLMDIEMPHINGVEGLKLIREIKQDAKVYAVTANALESQVKGYISCGFDDVITKPFTLREVLHKVERGISFGTFN